LGILNLIHCFGFDPEDHSASSLGFSPVRTVATACSRSIHSYSEGTLLAASWTARESRRSAFRFGASNSSLAVTSP
jgi:hypothetical protein